ncbi:MAG: hypothetical protein HYY10_00010 [Candidatus Liptonbacteria bacterium]|nr:hypothetical protein [Candidatus Liptonbacteria bacterium]
MYETDDGYIFATFQDGNVLFHKDSYETHCERHDAIKGVEGRESIQDALISPDFITSYPLKEYSGKVIAHCKKYRKITKGGVRTTRGEEWEYWEIILRKNLGKRKKIVSAYLTSSPKPFVINDRIEKIEYLKKK